MTRARRIAFWALVAAQALLPLALIGWNEVALATGERVRLATQPIDPVDLFRGRYVTLRYEISTLPLDDDAGRGETVYVVLEEERETWIGRSATRERPPDDETFIRGRVRSVVDGEAEIEYGIETYYADEAEARALERRAGRLHVDVVLGDDGEAKIDGIEPAD